MKCVSDKTALGLADALLIEGGISEAALCIVELDRKNEFSIKQSLDLHKQALTQAFRLRKAPEDQIELYVHIIMEAIENQITLQTALSVLSGPRHSRRR